MSKTSLRVQDLSLWVRLGCSEPERAQPQEVRLSLEIQFRETPGACFNDELIETVCYAELSGRLKNHCETREFKTVEKMAMDCAERVQETIGLAHEFTIDVHKVRPPVPGLNGGVVFRVHRGPNI